ncbi:TPA: DUF3440 domain-containing protein [Salmonella enterica subsp. enterica serovar Muenchen]|nr:DUF3440 domain-containing protein [Salmonella enterica subsp. enterica serovar Muenchen]HEC8860554.1 DUF3440 domain-containing protein [Salmonella enterica subsp. enterica serovar Muenchen]
MKPNNLKIFLGENVLDSTYKRIEWAFDTFDIVCVSFSGGKDSTLLFHLTADIARRKNKRFHVLFMDWEVQFSLTIKHILYMKQLYADVTEQFWWVALPLMTVSGVSQYQPEWISWARDTDWVRQPPSDAITESSPLPFWYYGMTFEEFTPAFAKWLSGGRGLITLTGVRADESLNRFRGLISGTKRRYADDFPWTTATLVGSCYTAYPLYDWKVKDIWLYHSKTGAKSNPLYDLMYQAGVPVRLMRICEPFGPEQRQGLWLYHVLEAETWGRVCRRVAGAHSGGLYSAQSDEFYAFRKNFSCPPGHTWRSYAMFLLDSMPETTAEHYRNKIAIYLKWYQTRGYPLDIPDSQAGDTGYKDIPSWKRICKTLIKNDFWCKTLSFSPNKAGNYQRYLKRIQARRKEWGIL